MANILVYGGAFDPFHKAHLANAHYARSKLMEMTGDHYELWLSLSYHDSLGEKKGLAENVHHRLEMLRLALKHDYAHVPDILICTLEIDAKNKMGTYELLSELQRQYPKYNFKFMMGMDAAIDIGKWRNSRKLRRDFSMVVSPRVIQRRSAYSGETLGVTNLNPWISWLRTAGSHHILLPQAPVSIPMASSAIRELIALKKYKEAKSLLPKSVYDYIRQHNLYQGEEHVFKPKNKARPFVPKRREWRRPISKSKP